MSSTNAVVADVMAGSAKEGLSLPFKLVLVYLLVEFGRPQDGLPLLGVLKLPMIAQICLGIQLAKATAPKFTEKTTKLFVVLLVFMVFHIPFAVNSFWAFHVARAMALTFVGFLGILTFVDSQKSFRTLINAWLVIHTFLAIWGLMHEGRGIGGWIGDENDFCLALNMALPYAYFRIFSENNLAKKTVYTGIVVLFLGAIMASLSRGGFLGLVAVGLYCWFRSPKKIISSLVILLFVIFLINFAPKGYWEEMETIQKEYSGEMKGTGSDRKYTWDVGWTMFVAKPFFGIGQGNFPWTIGDYEDEGGFEGRSYSGRAAHSLYYTLMPELGLLGIILFLGMILNFFKDVRLVRRLKKMKARPDGKDAELFYSACALEASLIAFLVTGYFLSVLYYPCFWILVGFAVALRKVAIADDKKGFAAH